jgi:membrane protein
MANGLNAIFGGFENSRHVLVKARFRQYMIAVECRSFINVALVTVGVIVVFEVFIHKLTVIKY